MGIKRKWYCEVIWVLDLFSDGISVIVGWYRLEFRVDAVLICF